MARNSRVRVVFDSDTRGLQRGTAQAEAQLKKVQRAGTQSAAALGGVSRRAVGVAAGFVGIGAGAMSLKSSIDYTKALAIGTAALDRVTGLGVKTSSRWVAVAKSLNLEHSKLSMGFTKLSKQMTAAADGSKTAAKLFKDLGVSQELVASGDFDKVLLAVAEGMEKLGPSSRRTALASQLFGRSYQPMLLMMGKGKDELEQLLEASDKYGTTLSGKQLKSIMASVKAQRLLNLALSGFKVTIATSVLPALTSGVDALNDLFTMMREGKGVPGQLVGWVKDAFNDLETLFSSGMAGFKTGAGVDFIGPLLPDNRSFVEKLIDGLTEAFKAINWGQIITQGDALADTIRKAIGDAIVNLDVDSLSETFTTVLVKMFVNLTDPVWWFKHIDLMIMTALTVSKVGWLRKIPILGKIFGTLGDFLWKIIEKSLKFVGRLAGAAAKGIGKGILDGIVKGLEKLPVWMGVALTALWNVIKRYYSKVFKVGLGLGDKIVDGVESGARAIAGAGSKAIVWLVRGVVGLLGRLFSAGRSVGGKLRDGIAALWKRFYSLGGFLLGKLKDGLISAPLNGLKALGTRIKNAIQSGIGKITASLGIGGTVGAMAFGKDGGGLGAVTGMAARFGNMVTSGYRPGDGGWHGKNRARDYAGGNMAGFAKAVAGKFGSRLLELIHTPLGWGIKNGKKVAASYFGPAVMADHYDHVHVAMRRGGKAGPGAGGPQLVEWGEGNKTEWWISQEGDPKHNTELALEALEAVAGDRLSMFKKGGKKPKQTAAQKKAAKRKAARRRNERQAAKRDLKYAQFDADLAAAEMTEGTDDDEAILSGRIKANEAKAKKIEKLLKKKGLGAGRKAAYYRELADVRSAIKSDRDTIAGFHGTTDSTTESTTESTEEDPNVMAQRDQALRARDVAQKAASIAGNALSVFQGAGDIGYGRGNVIVQTLHPGDPRTLKAIGDAAAAGFAGQGYVRQSKIVGAV